jgi:Ca2+-binding EF-hand superfamily protein
MRKFLTVCLLGVFALGNGLSPALAAKVKKDPSRVFQKRDANGDGSLSLQELRGKGKKASAKVEKRFKRLDRNHDGKVSLDELKARGKAKVKAKTNKKSA